MIAIARTIACSTIAGFIALGVPMPVRAASAPSDPVAAKTATYVTGAAARAGFSGVVLLARNGQPLYTAALGKESREYGVDNTVDTEFNLGSIDKLFTHIAIVQLVEARELSYDDTIGKLLPDYPNKDAAAVTVQELLDMTSGIGDFFGPGYEALPKDRLRTLQDYVPLFASTPLEFVPGTQRQYSNGGYIVLGLIIERIAKQSYFDYVRTHIFAPAGMTRTGWPQRDEINTGIATGYTTVADDGSNGPVRNNIYTAPARGSSAGGGYSTAPDLLDFADALIAGRLIDASDVEQLVGDGIGVAGGAPGINADLDIDRQSGYELVVLSNGDPPSATSVAATIRGFWGADVRTP
jgi:D-alanyl-D-alanine carboxypeptidase